VKLTLTCASTGEKLLVVTPLQPAHLRRVAVEHTHQRLLHLHVVVVDPPGARPVCDQPLPGPASAGDAVHLHGEGTDAGLLRHVPDFQGAVGEAQRQEPALLGPFDECGGGVVVLECAQHLHVAAAGVPEVDGLFQCDCDDVGLGPVGEGGVCNDCYLSVIFGNYTSVLKMGPKFLPFLREKGLCLF
jgi:hypothetical protein